MLTHRLESAGVWEPDCQLSEQAFDVPAAEVESIVEPNGMADDIWRESVAFISIHGLIIRYGQLSCQYPMGRFPNRSITCRCACHLCINNNRVVVTAR